MNKAWGIIILLIIGALAATFFLKTPAVPAISINEQLQGFDTAHIDDEHLALYWLLAKVDPLFAMPGADLTSMEKDLEFLDILLLSVTDTYTPEENATINDSLYPTDFLREMIVLEKNRTEFIAVPTREKAEQYHEQLIATAASYQSALTMMSNTLDSLDDMTIGFVAGTTSAPLIATKLKGVHQDVDRLINLEAGRFECLTKNSETCAYLKNIPAPLSVEASKSDHQISPEVWGNKEALDAFYTAKTASSTLIVLENSLCYPSGQPVTYAYWSELNDLLPNVPFIRATPVDDLFIQDLKKSVDNPYYKSLLDAGLEYSLQPMNLYFCVDGGVEYQRLATIKKIYSLAVVKELPEVGSLPEDIVAVMDLAPLASDTGNVLYERSALAYVDGIEKLFDKYSEIELLGLIGKDTYETWRDISLLWRTETADYDQLIRTALYMTETNRGVLDITEIPMEPLYLTRSYISLLFLLGNQTINQERISLLNQPALQDIDSFFMTSGNEIFPSLADKTKLKEMLIENRRKAP